MVFTASFAWSCSCAVAFDYISKNRQTASEEAPLFRGQVFAGG